jgi:bifunctional DNase/RNase
MDRELKMHGYELTIHEITQARLIKLNDENGDLLLIVPMEMFAVNAFFRSLVRQDGLSIPAHKMFVDLMERLGGAVEKVVVDDLQDGQFFATLHFTDFEEVEHTIKAEAGDAIVMSIISACPVYTLESVIEKAKNDRRHRVYWYDPNDDQTLEIVRYRTRDELENLPKHELEQLIEIAVGVEDFELAARLKKALDVLTRRIKEFEECIQSTIASDPEKYIKEMQEMLNRRLNGLDDDDDPCIPDDDDDDE